jgi:hypothetical protein
MKLFKNKNLTWDEERQDERKKIFKEGMDVILLFLK